MAHSTSHDNFMMTTLAKVADLAMLCNRIDKSANYASFNISMPTPLWGSQLFSDAHSLHIKIFLEPPLNLFHGPDYRVGVIPKERLAWPGPPILVCLCVTTTKIFKDMHPLCQTVCRYRSEADEFQLRSN